MKSENHKLKIELDVTFSKWRKAEILYSEQDKYYERSSKYYSVGLSKDKKKNHWYLLTTPTTFEGQIIDVEFSEMLKEVFNVSNGQIFNSLSESKKTIDKYIETFYKFVDPDFKLLK